MSPETFSRVLRSGRRALLLDYDGTLVPFAPRPELAQPDRELLALLRRLAALPGTDVHVVSGRPRSVLDEWLGALPVGLHAEHGVWSSPLRAHPGADPRAWERRALEHPRGLAAATELLAQTAARLAGALIERKSLGAALHYRGVEPALALEALASLERALSEHAAVDGGGVEVLHGAMVLELRARGVHKGRIVEALSASSPRDTLFVAAGDDRTDEDLFEATRATGGVALHVGIGPSIAHEMLADHVAVRSFLSRLCDESAAQGAVW